MEIGIKSTKTNRAMMIIRRLIDLPKEVGFPTIYPSRVKFKALSIYHDAPVPLMANYSPAARKYLSDETWGRFMRLACRRMNRPRVLHGMRRNSGFQNVNSRKTMVMVEK
jgi:hypothetical protein